VDDETNTDIDSLPDEYEFLDTSGGGTFELDGLEFSTVRELAEYMRRLLDVSLIDFKKLCHKLVDYNGKLDAQFETWLINMGKAKELANWRESVREWI